MKRTWWTGQSAGMRVLAILGSMGVVAYADHQLSATLPVSHLYYLPIVLGALSFGYIGGLATAASAILFFHLIHFGLPGKPIHFAEADVLRFVLFLAAGLITARLVDDRQRLSRLARDLEARNAELTGLNQRLMDLSQARADFVAIASHELKTPLTMILASAEQLQERRAMNPERQETLLALIYDGARRLQRTVENVFDTALVESGQLRLQSGEVRLEDLLTEVARTFTGAGAERLMLVEPVPEVALCGDKDRLVQVLTNLVGNALKYSPEGSPVTIRGEHQSGWVVIAVSDRGYGILAADIPHIFERYYRAKDGRIQAARGAGLGLSISRDIMRAHGGDLLVRSEPRRGSTFTMVLPTHPRHPARGESSRPDDDAVRSPRSIATMADRLHRSAVFDLAADDTPVLPTDDRGTPATATCWRGCHRPPIGR